MPFALDGSPWELVWDDGTLGPGGMLCDFDTNNLYWISSTGTHGGLWRLHSGTWTQISVADPYSPNMVFGYGATAYNGSIIAGSSTGVVYKIGLNADGTFVANTQIQTTTSEDSFAGPVFNGKMYGGHHNIARLWSWDGTTFAIVADFSTTFEAFYGVTAKVDNFAIGDDGLLYFTVSTNNGTQHQWLCTMDESETVEVLSIVTMGAHFPDSLVHPQGGLANWRGGIVASMYPSTAEEAGVYSWDGNDWSLFSAQHRSGPILPVGDDLLMLATTNIGPRFISPDGTSFPTSSYAKMDGMEQAGAAGGPNSPRCAKIHDGFIWLVFGQDSIQLWRLPIGSEDTEATAPLTSHTRVTLHTGAVA